MLPNTIVDMVTLGRRWSSSTAETGNVDLPAVLYLSRTGTSMTLLISSRVAGQIGFSGRVWCRATVPGDVRDDVAEKGRSPESCAVSALKMRVIQKPSQIFKTPESVHFKICANCGIKTPESHGSCSQDLRGLCANMEK